MEKFSRSPRRLACLTLVVVAAALGGPAGALASSTPPAQSGGGAFTPPSLEAPVTPPPPGSHTRGVWLSRVAITEYWAVPESWFTGALVSAPGLPGRHRVDWLYSAEGISMDGEGIGLDGELYHVSQLGAGGWVTAAGKPTNPLRGWSGGSPFWRSGGYWRNAFGGVTFPLAAGGWSAGPGRRYVPLKGASFAPGPSLPLHPYQSIAVDPRVIPLGSRVYIPAYRGDGHGGWFVAADTGGAIRGHRIDVYRTPPAAAATGGQYLAGQRIFVVRPPS